MCESCSPAAVEVIGKDFYQQKTREKDVLLDSPHLIENFGEAYDELLLSYASFVEQVFSGMLDEEERIQLRQQQWENQFQNLKEKIEEAKNQPEQLEFNQEATEEPDPGQAFLDMLRTRTAQDPQ